MHRIPNMLIRAFVLVAVLADLGACTPQHRFEGPTAVLILTQQWATAFAVATVTPQGVSIVNTPTPPPSDYRGLASVGGEVFVQCSKSIQRLDLVTGRCEPMSVILPRTLEARRHQITAADGALFVVCDQGVARVNPASGEARFLPSVRCRSDSEIVSDGRCIAVLDSENTVVIHDTRTSTTHIKTLENTRGAPQLLGMVNGIVLLNLETHPSVIAVTAQADMRLYSRLAEILRDANADQSLVCINGLPWLCGNTVLPGYAATHCSQVGGRQQFTLKGWLDPDLVFVTAAD